MSIVSASYAYLHLGVVLLEWGLLRVTENILRDYMLTGKAPFGGMIKGQAMNVSCSSASLFERDILSHRQPNGVRPDFL